MYVKELHSTTLKPTCCVCRNVQCRMCRLNIENVQRIRLPDFPSLTLPCNTNTLLTLRFYIGVI